MVPSNLLFLVSFLLFFSLICDHSALSTNLVDLNLTTTGKTIIVVTPGVGVFEVSCDAILISHDLVAWGCLG